LLPQNSKVFLPEKKPLMLSSASSNVLLAKGLCILSGEYEEYVSFQGNKVFKKHLFKKEAS